eukprot:1508634-Pyramimonas_sp.AAC.1
MWERLAGSGLADKFDTDADFRESLHQATRDALFVPSPKFTKEVNDRVKSAGSTLCVAWTRAETIACDEITKVHTHSLSGHLTSQRLVWFPNHSPLGKENNPPCYLISTLEESRLARPPLPSRKPPSGGDPRTTLTSLDPL